MVAPFKCDEVVTIERLAGTKDPEYGTPIKGVGAWVVVASRVWANAVDLLPSRAESVENGLSQSVTRTRLRMRRNSAITTAMRVTLHGHDERVMQIISGPALLDDRVHVEFMLEGYTTNG